ncbi:MAG: hypothetical protein IKQ06_01575 [Bacilli bacterium]|nr:hypothetical protein [Bacilli bacterium]
MALDLEQSTIGYDRSAMERTLQNVHNDCVLHAQTKLRNSLNNLSEDVKKCWAGQSARNFMLNMITDVDQICKGLDAAYDGLEGEFKMVLSGLSQVDQELIERR